MNNKEVKEQIISLIVDDLIIPRKNIETIIKYQQDNKDNYLVIINGNARWDNNNLLTGEKIMIIGKPTINNLIERLSEFIINPIKNGEAIHNELGLIKLKRKINEKEMILVE